MGVAENFKEKGDKAYDARDFNKAIIYYSLDVGFRPHAIDSWYNLAGSLAKIKMFEESVKCYDKVIELNPKDADAWFNKGNALKSMGNINAAVECYNRVLQINPRDADAQRNLVECQSEIYKQQQPVQIEPVQISPTYQTAETPHQHPQYPCQYCGQPLTYIQEYQRWYCNNCRKYADQQPLSVCPNCGVKVETGWSACPFCGKDL